MDWFFVNRIPNRRLSGSGTGLGDGGGGERVPGFKGAGYLQGRLHSGVVQEVLKIFLGGGGFVFGKCQKLFIPLPPPRIFGEKKWNWCFSNRVFWMADFRCILWEFLVFLVIERFLNNGNGKFVNLKKKKGKLYLWHFFFEGTITRTMLPKRRRDRIGARWQTKRYWRTAPNLNRAWLALRTVLQVSS